MPKLVIPELLRSADGFVHRSNVCMRDADQVQKKLLKLSTGGPHKLQVLSDFDFTLSRSTLPDGSDAWTTYALFDMKRGLISDYLAEKLIQLRDHYRPIEFDAALSTEAKIPAMEEWWNKAHEYVVESGVTCGQIEHFLKDSKIALRDYAQRFLEALERLGVPLVIFSAGIGNVIEVVLKMTFGRLPANIHLISNFMNFDDQGRICGFKPPLVHTFNKGTAAVSELSAFASELCQRPNVLLMGDSLGDVHMDSGLVDEDCVLRIGFLNEKEEELFPKFLNLYDMVVLKDQTFEVPNLVLRCIVGSVPSCQ